MVDYKFIKNLMIELGQKHSLFHSEADFQHELSFLIHKKYTNWKIKLERPYLIDKKLQDDSKHKYHQLDIFIGTPDKRIGIELKYTTRELKTNFNGEEYDLATHGALGTIRYNFLKEIKRLEYLKSSVKKIDKGFAVLLTNVESLQEFPKSTSKMPGRQDALSLEQNRMIKKGEEIKFIPTPKGDFEPFEFKNDYRIMWEDEYFDKAKNFRYLIIAV